MAAVRAPDALLEVLQACTREVQLFKNSENQGAGVANDKAVAFLAREIGGSSASEMLFRGALAAVERNGQNLVVFRGGYIGKDPGAVVYEVINDSFLGAIDWASSSQDASQHPVARRKKQPLVTLTQRMQGCPVVVNDSHSGIRALVEHLIQAHGKQRIAFFRGPEDHPLAQERFLAYQEVLKESGLGFDERLVSPCGNWDRTRGNELIRLLVDERQLKPGVDFDAVVCVNDNIALGTIMECQARGIRVPDDLAVTGCNDIHDSRVNMPPVTTVALPGDAQAAGALEVLNALLRREPVQDVTRLPGQPILRQSCGCASQQVVAAVSGLVPLNTRFGLLTRLGGLLRSLGFYSETGARAAVKAALHSQIKGAEAHAELLEAVAEILVRGFGEEAGWSRTPGAFNRALIEAVRRFELAGLTAETLQIALSALRRHRLPSLWRRGRILRAEDVFSQARVMLSEVSVQLHETANMKSLELERAVSQLGARMTTTHETAALVKLLNQELPKLGIPGFYLGVYEGEAGWDRLSVPGRLRLLTAFDKQNAAPMSRDTMAVNDLLPFILQRGRARQSLVVVPLHFNEVQIGMAVFVLGPRDGTLYESMKVQLSSSLYGSLLRQTLRDTLLGMEGKVAEVSGNAGQIKLGVRNGSSAMEGVVGSIRGISEHVQEVAQVIDAAVKLAAGAADDIATLNKQSQEITKVTALITQIAQQTNMLALNAAIEAARAGEAGRGFAVVAEEVKSLAVNTVNSSASIHTLIQSVRESATRTQQSIDGMNDIMRKIADSSGGIATSIADQERSTDAISHTLTEAARGTEDIATALAELNELSRNAARI